jgi:hypothetical protein
LNPAASRRERTSCASAGLKAVETVIICIIIFGGRGAPCAPAGL